MRKYLIALFAIVLFVNPLTTQAKAANTTIENGIYIGEVNVSNMNLSEAKTAVWDYIYNLNSEKLTLNAMNNNEVTMNLGDIGLTWSNEGIVETAIALGKEGNIIKRYKALKDLEHENKVFDMELDFDKELIRAQIEEQATPFNVSAEDATITRENGEFIITEGTTGVVVDVDGSADKVYTYLATEWLGEQAVTDLVMEVDEPRGTKEELSKIKDTLGSFTTSYATSGSNRSGNVANGVKLVNDTLLYPGDTFSMYNTVSPFTEANGYYMAGSYAGGLVVDSLGGGICQVSTTLYNAVLKAELEVVERHNHSMIVTYVDPSADAAIAGEVKDFKFVNNYDFPIYIEGYTKDKKLTFNIYGIEERPSNRTVTYESNILTTTVPEGEKVIADGSQGVGYVNVQSSHTGYTAELWKIVKEDGVEVSRTKVNSSSYKATPRTASVGIVSADPNATAAVQAAIATQSIDHVRNVVAAVTTDPNQAAAQAALAAQQAAIAAQQAAANQAAEQ